VKIVQCLPLALLLGLAALLNAEPPHQGENLRLQEGASGVWGFPVEGASCEDNPHTIKFLEGSKTMILRYAKGLDGNPPTEATYQILGEGPGYLRMEIRGETTTTEAGKPVQWDLVLLSSDSYCWHRTDWQLGGCTQPATRCKKDFVVVVVKMPEILVSNTL